MLNVQERPRAKDGTFTRFHKEFSLENFGDGYTAIGRFRVYLPNHPRRNNQGFVLRSVAAYEAYHHLAVPLSMDIHHIDGNTMNDSKENLQMLLHNEHVQIRQRAVMKYIAMTCPVCGKSFTHYDKNPQKFCSLNCYHKGGHSDEHKQKISIGLLKVAHRNLKCPNCQERAWDKLKHRRTTNDYVCLACSHKFTYGEGMRGW